ncbi:hypothetical protein PVAND_017156 [Polypedilum vanderplanki]|uniref:Uncharacterized protein n=1 Tax=Polypedilum vanderplanki TaxID=319348 RepID=A0A9J6BHA2_POLVA|nr:hypothetical protein PVAND_017156 [Polypedilum vanderplanki]
MLCVRNTSIKYHWSKKSAESPFDVHIVLTADTGTTSYTIIDFQFDWCSFLSGKVDNKILSLLIGVIRNVLTSLFLDCPYYGNFEIKNFKFSQNMNLVLSTVLPNGKIQLEITALKNNNTVLNIRIDMESKSIF